MSLAFVRGIHRGPVNSPHKWPVTRKMFPFDDVIMGSLRVQRPLQINMETDVWFSYCHERSSYRTSVCIVLHVLVERGMEVNIYIYVYVISAKILGLDWSDERRTAGSRTSLGVPFFLRVIPHHRQSCNMANRTIFNPYMQQFFFKEYIPTFPIISRYWDDASSTMKSFYLHGRRDHMW